MNEQEWLECTDPTPMLEHLRGKASDRKLRLFAVACCLRVWDWIGDERSRGAVKTAESYADGAATDQQRQQAYDAAPDDIAYGAAYAAHANAFTAAIDGPDLIRKVVHIDDDGNEEWVAQAILLRHIFGNPFRPVTINPAWLAWNDGMVRKIAQGIYDERAFDRLPILADALTDAGCDNTDILNHCRSEGPHVKGCWVVDLLLGKT